MLCYLMGTFGVILALLGSHNSPYAAFHVRQALKFSVMNILLGIVALLLCFTVIVPILCAVLRLVAADRPHYLLFSPSATARRRSRRSSVRSASCVNDTESVRSSCEPLPGQVDRRKNKKFSPGPHLRGPGFLLCSIQQAAVIHWCKAI